MTEIDLNLPFEGTRKEFKTAEEFKEFYNKYPEKFEGLTSTKLNKMYHIVGCRISKPKKAEGKIVLIKDYYFDPVNKSEEKDSKLDMIEELLKNMKRTINDLNNRLIAVESYLSETGESS